MTWSVAFVPMIDWNDHQKNLGGESDREPFSWEAAAGTRSSVEKKCSLPRRRRPEKHKFSKNTYIEKMEHQEVFMKQNAVILPSWASCWVLLCSHSPIAHWPIGARFLESCVRCAKDTAEMPLTNTDGCNLKTHQMWAIDCIGLQNWPPKTKMALKLTRLQHQDHPASSEFANLFVRAATKAAFVWSFSTSLSSQSKN